ncbi:MAG: hypothetical protein K0R78_1767 [Pelosinus sp.]|jgi:hypothetical protein|nr:hypothetical protein [Pelosinus sp.]
MQLANNKTPEELENKKTEYTSWQRGVLTFLRWGAWTASFIAIAHVIDV